MPMLEVNDTRLYYQRQPNPSKPVLLLSHSLLFDRSMFDPLIGHLAGDFDIISYDHRGQGGSDRNGALDMDTLSEDALALMDALGVRQFHVAGNSMGGFIALRLAIRHPERVAGCVVMGSSADRELRLAEFEPLVEAIAQQGVSPHIDTLTYIMFGDTSLTDPSRSAMVGHWHEWMLALPIDIARAARGVIHRDPIIERLPSLRAPLLVLAGEQDHVYPVEQSEAIIKHCGHGHCAVIAGAGHSVALEAPEDVARQINQWMNLL